MSTFGSGDYERLSTLATIATIDYNDYVDFEKGQRLYRLFDFSTISTFRPFTGSRKNPGALASGFCFLAARCVRRGANVTDSHTGSVLTGLHGVFVQGVVCLYSQGQNALRTRLNAFYTVRLFLGIKKPCRIGRGTKKTAPETGSGCIIYFL